MHIRDAQCMGCGSTMLPVCRFPDTGKTAFRCVACGHRQLLPQPDEAALQAFYGREEYFSDDLAALHDDLTADYDLAAPIVRLYGRHLDRIADAVAPPARMLEVGCARGVFAHLAAARGYDVTVIDRNPHAVGYARDRFGLTGVTGSFEDADVGGPYDVIAAYDVIEHMPSQKVFFAKAASLLAPGGVAVIGTPDADAPLLVAAELAARVTGGRWQYPLWRVYGDGREHLHLCSRASLAQFARGAGLEPESSYGYSIPAANMRAMPAAYAAAVRVAAAIPYETVLIARKK